MTATDFHLPSTLENAVEEGGYKYVAAVYDLHFEGCTLDGKASLEVYLAEDKKHLAIQVWPPRVSFEEKPYISYVPSQYHTDIFVSYGNVINDRTQGYRREVVAAMANSGLNVSDELLGRIYGPIESELLRLYLTIFPKQENPAEPGAPEPWCPKELPTLTVEGRIEEASIWRLKSQGIVTLYVVRPSDSLDVVRLGLEVASADLKVDDVARFWYQEKIIAMDNNSGLVSIGDTMAVVEDMSKYFKIVKYQKL